MPWFAVYLRTGLNGVEVPLGNLELTNSGISNISELAGSYHILEMGQHFFEYSVSPGPFPPFPRSLIPSTYPFLALANKQRAAGVTGNIGEGIGGVVARHVFGMPPGTFPHIKLKGRGRRQTPDFMFNLGPYLSNEHFASQVVSFFLAPTCIRTGGRSKQRLDKPPST